MRCFISDGFGSKIHQSKVYSVYASPEKKKKPEAKNFEISKKKKPENLSNYAGIQAIQALLALL